MWRMRRRAPSRMIPHEEKRMNDTTIDGLGPTHQLVVEAAR
jgi:hypothetical protein